VARREAGRPDRLGSRFRPDYGDEDALERAEEVSLVIRVKADDGGWKWQLTGMGDLCFEAISVYLDVIETATDPAHHHEPTSAGGKVHRE